MADSYSESFEQASGKASDKAGGNAPHGLKLSIDLLSVKNMQVAANVVIAYQLRLRETHSFQSSPPTSVGQNQMQDTELRNCFSSYDFHATKDELAQILNQNTLHVKVLHHI